ncbi:MAG: PAS domain S-box protein, partial [Methylococcus sp.]
MNLLPRRGLAMLILLCLLLGGVGVRFYQTQLQQAESRAREQLLSVARLKVERIAAWRRERMDDGRLLNANRLLLAGFRDWLNGTADPAVRGDLTAVFEALQRNYGYRDYLLVDAAGRVRLQSGAPSAVALEAEAQAALAEVRRSREPRLTELHIDLAFPFPHLSLVVPLWQGETPAGALILVMDARQTLFPLLTTWPIPSRTAESLLVRREGDTVLLLSEARHQPDSALRLRQPLTRTDLPAVQAVLGKTGVLAGQDYRGEAVLAAVFPVPETPWLLIAKMDRRELYAGARREAMLAGGGLLAVLALVVALVATVWQRRLREQTQWRLRAQTAERESLERFRNLFEQSQDGILLLSPDFRVLDANPAAQALLGYAHAALLGMRLPDLLAPEELPRIAPAVDQIMAGEPHRGEWRQRRADGATFLAQVTAQRLDAECYYATLRDITRQRELETAQAETTRRLQLILNEATDGLWDWNIRTGEDFHAPRYWEMLGYDPDERPAIDTAAVFEALVHPDDLPRVHTALQAHLERREPYQVELRLRTKSGDYRWFVTRGQAEWDADDQPLRMAGFITDISGRKAAEEALQASEARLDYALT